MTKNNTEARLIVGQEIGIPQAQADFNPNSGFSTRSPLSRRDVGITLKVTPQINEGGYVTMEIEVESSSTVESSVGIDANETGATIAKASMRCWARTSCSSAGVSTACECGADRIVERRCRGRFRFLRGRLCSVAPQAQDRTCRCHLRGRLSAV